MKRLIDKLLLKFFSLFSFLKEENISFFLFYLIKIFSLSRNAKSSLQLLLGLEQKLVSLTGIEATRYNNGIHTKHRHTDYHRFFYSHLKPGEKVIDIGSGNGYLAFDMADKASAMVTAIEISKSNYQQAVDKFSHPNIKFILGDALTFLLPEKFDTVVMSNVLEHIENRNEFIRKIQAQVDPKRWLLRVPMYDRDWRVPLMDEVGIDSRADNSHFIEYTEKSFKEELERAGLKITYQEIHWGEIWCEAIKN